MAGIMDGLGKAVSKLANLGEKAVDGAKDLYEKAKPAVEETFDKVAGYRDKEKNYYKNRIERYEKCRDQVIETADKLGIEKGE